MENRYIDIITKIIENKANEYSKNHSLSPAYFLNLLPEIKSSVLAVIKLYGYPEIDDALLLIFNAGSTTVPFCMPTVRGASHWRCLFDTAQSQRPSGELVLENSDDFQMEPWSVTVFALVMAAST